MAQIYIIFIYNTFIFYIFSNCVIFVDVIVFFFVICIIQIKYNFIERNTYINCVEIVAI